MLEYNLKKYGLFELSQNFKQEQIQEQSSTRQVLRSFKKLEQIPSYLLSDFALNLDKQCISQELVGLIRKKMSTYRFSTKKLSLSLNMIAYSTTTLQNLFNALAQAEMCKCLQLYYCHNQVTSEVSEIIGRFMRYYFFLERVDLDISYCTDFSIKDVNNIISSIRKTLTHFSINFKSANITDICLKHISKTMESFTKIQSLFIDLSQNQITKAGVREFFYSLKQMNYLRELGLTYGGNNLELKDVMFEVRNMKKLKSLYLGLQIPSSSNNLFFDDEAFEESFDYHSQFIEQEKISQYCLIKSSDLIDLKQYVKELNELTSLSLNIQNQKYVSPYLNLLICPYLFHLKEVRIYTRGFSMQNQDAQQLFYNMAHMENLISITLKLEENSLTSAIGEYLNYMIKRKYEQLIKLDVSFKSNILDECCISDIFMPLFKCEYLTEFSFTIFDGDNFFYEEQNQDISMTFQRLLYFIQSQCIIRQSILLQTLIQNKVMQMK
ncbi:hypothetical protein TTHERM_00711850 (macronuclear) [Tetrahymena thermophila SB210]|uniref:Kinase domain protein n=1 Tax=Tetrahymena thermophila (strain SB210) TaxID=312017 RepID=Q24D08_TETTS|nr:hypothetical protein TTHERM_00711850 [Tetrahymena thermophila SB210]EAS05600.2 hypothetical protein TTHERM_00711850 [Tetrahymena thermophila SB210]|eukprot:XP_001025845.2 hypothetical protein TTHERM_00711850 [Tetrahymena thermophila SB210]